MIDFFRIFLKIIRILIKIASRNFIFTSMTIGYFIVFVFILYNALWNQKGKHPSPIFITRNHQSDHILLGSILTDVEQLKDKGIIFKVEKVDEKGNKIFLKKSS
ncbi:hypothetical protein [Candidatus Liberibacter brunswickensis]|uniref:hypothetical protein n=1 Tax=Candidatus Liberibacter brunswickensis TaxID=1968796 RepID=UPI002FE1D0D4